MLRVVAFRASLRASCVTVTFDAVYAMFVREWVFLFRWFKCIKSSRWFWNMYEFRCLNGFVLNL